MADESVASFSIDGEVHQDTSHLATQDLATLDPTKLTPLTAEVISRQATINIGTIGHVAHGKSTVVKALSGVQTMKRSTEIARNITIKLGYANAKLFECDNKECSKPGSFKSATSFSADELPCNVCKKGTLRLVRHVSFVDCPGHDILMATMLTGAAVMDAALLLIAGDESCPQPQTSEHLAAIEIMRLKDMIILQNKIDLVKDTAARSQHKDIINFVKGTVAEGAPIIPISAQMGYNIDVLAEYMVKKLPVPKRNFTAPARLIVVRSFDINKPGASADDLKGGVAGGSILQGVLKIGDLVEVRPGVVTTVDGKSSCTPIYSRIVSLFAEANNLQYAIPGGLIGVGTTIDPALCRNDRLVGQVLGAVGTLPNVYTELQVNFYLLRNLLGVRNDSGKSKIEKLSKGEVLMVNIGSTSTGGKILGVKEDLTKIALNTPVCTEEGEKIALSRRVEGHWRLIGWGKIISGEKVELHEKTTAELEEMKKLDLIAEAEEKERIAKKKAEEEADAAAEDEEEEEDEEKGEKSKKEDK